MTASSNLATELLADLKHSVKEKIEQQKGVTLSADDIPDSTLIAYCHEALEEGYAPSAYNIMQAVIETLKQKARQDCLAAGINEKTFDKLEDEYNCGLDAATHLRKHLQGDEETKEKAIVSFKKYAQVEEDNRHYITDLTDAAKGAVDRHHQRVTERATAETLAGLAALLPTEVDAWVEPAKEKQHGR